MKRFAGPVLLMLGLATLAAGCAPTVVYARRAPCAGGAWVPGHFGPRGRWIPAHWRCAGVVAVVE